MLLTKSQRSKVRNQLKKLLSVDHQVSCFDSLVKKLSILSH